MSLLIPPEDLDRKIDAIIAYLHARQASDGSFPTLRRFPKGVPDYVTPSDFDGWYHWGPCGWIAAVIAYHLPIV